ncbi:hypothetical protein V9T40_006217 [Parthenolecanium corni]|uniref:Uncharacterized protein n=1 Tax=Parthenolecanium corni TaxID=536013 RepID=A0AAN9YAA2_9HEMI
MVALGNGSIKEQACCILYTMYQASMTRKTNEAGKMDKVKAYSNACQYAKIAYENCKVPVDVRSRFSEFLKTQDISYKLLVNVWTKILNGVTNRDDTVEFTGFHSVINAKPDLDEEWLKAKYQTLMKETSNITAYKIIANKKPQVPAT